MMKELDLIKVLMHKLAIIERRLAKLDELEDLIEYLFEQEECLKAIQNSLKEMKMNMEIKHIENINSNDILFRSILDKKEVQYK